MLETLLLLASLTIQVPDNDTRCFDLDKMANKYMGHMHAEHLRPVKEEGVAAFNRQEPKTDWTQVWLMDLPHGGGVVLAGHDDQVCMEGLFNPKVWPRILEDLEGNNT